MSLQALIQLIRKGLETHPHTQPHSQRPQQQWTEQLAAEAPVQGTAVDLSSLAEQIKQRFDTLVMHAALTPAPTPSLGPVDGDAAGGDAASLSLSPLLIEIRELNYPQYALGVIFLLSAQCETLNHQRVGSQMHKTFLVEAVKMMLHAPPQHVKLAVPDFVKVARKACQIACDLNEPKRVILALVAAADALRPSTHCLTPLHASVLQCCILAKCYGFAYTFISQRLIFEINPRDTCLEPVDYLRYFYYAATVCIGQKNYSEAMDHLMKVLTAPGSVLSAVSVSSYKRAMLLSLIKDGRSLVIPKHASSVMIRLSKQRIPTYTAMVEKFEAGDVDGLCAVITEGHNYLIPDQNTGLAKTALRALARHKIRRLTHTYMTLSLQDMQLSAGFSSIAEAERELLRMVLEGSVSATIDQATSMVCFQDDEEALDDARVLNRLELAMANMVDLGQKIREMESKIITTPNFVAKSNAASRGMGMSVGMIGGPTQWADEAEYGDYERSALA